jgi:hypothetical protein
MPRRPPARRFGQAKPDVPLWRRGKAKRAKQSEKDAIARAVAAHLAKQGATPAPAPGVNKFLATTGAYRFRYQIVPFVWLGAVVALGLAAHAHHAPWQGAVLGLISAAVILGLTRHTKGFARKAAQWIAGLTVVWVPLLALLGFGKPLPPVLLACWVCVLVPWVRHYRIRRDAPAPAPMKATDYEIWAKLAAKRKWTGHLGMPEEIPGGVRYPIVLDGSETDIGEVLGQPRKVAAAWGKAMTEAYVEPSPDGIESKGSLTLLRRGTLEKVREWDGSGVDHETGMAVIGRYADSTPARIRFYARRDGIRHGLIAGATGAGKTYLLDLIVRIALTTGFIVPVILDPQEGQSLPQWRKRVPYAAGVDECMAMLLGLQAGMLDRSRLLAGLNWQDEDGYNHEGMDFYDPFLSCAPALATYDDGREPEIQLQKLPIVMIIGDEFPVLLTHPKHGPEAIRVTADIGKRGRKTGVSLWPVAQVPSLSELGDQVVRSMLVGGNVVCLRTGDRVSAGMLGLDVDPSSLPRYFPDGNPTYGLGYVVGPDNRQAVARADLVSAAARRGSPSVPDLEPNFADWLDNSLKAARLYLERQSRPAAPSAASLLAAVPPPDEDETAPGGRTAADAILAVLDEADGPLERGEIVRRTRTLVTGQWGREKPFSVKAQGNALAKLTAEGRIQKTDHGTYAPARASLHVVGAEGSTS